LEGNDHKKRRKSPQPGDDQGVKSFVEESVEKIGGFDFHMRRNARKKGGGGGKVLGGNGTEKGV